MSGFFAVGHFAVGQFAARKKMLVLVWSNKVRLGFLILQQTVLPRKILELIHLFSIINIFSSKNYYLYIYFLFKYSRIGVGGCVWSGKSVPYWVHIHLKIHCLS